MTSNESGGEILLTLIEPWTKNWSKEWIEKHLEQLESEMGDDFEVVLRVRKKIPLAHGQ
jgi:hypothetical protein